MMQELDPERCEWRDGCAREDELTQPLTVGEDHDVTVFDPEPLVTEREEAIMPDSEAHYILKRISQTQREIDAIVDNAKGMQAQERSDLKGFLGHYERLSRLLNWRASKLKSLPKNRKTITTLNGSIGSETVKARLVVANEADALDWCRTHCPEAIVQKIDATKLPAPEKLVGDWGEAEWVAPEGSGLIAEAERDELKINNRQLSTLLKERG